MRKIFLKATRIVAASFILILCSTLFTAAQINIIPVPNQVKTSNSKFTLTAQTKIFYQNGLKAQAELLAAALSPATGFDFDIKEAKTASSGIFLSLGQTNQPNKEGYQLSVNAQRIQVSATTAAGVFYGTQTLLQLLPPAIYSPVRQKEKLWAVNGVEISDAPQFPWRGMMLDVARYFLTKEYVLKYIDLMAMYKMNTLHFHLIDDAGWRLEIKKYPRLTSIGGFSGEGMARRGGYYTQEDIKEMVTYAALRNVEIIPEIELPAHTLSALAAYPYLGCVGENYSVQTQHSISQELYCVGKESTFQFLEDVFAEAALLFPSKYLHIGGDEAVYTRWKSCPNCQKRKAELKLDKEKDLQVYFNKRVQQMLKKHSKTIVGWDEILEDGLAEKAVGMIWHNPEKTSQAVKAGHDVIMSITQFCYFDMPENNQPEEIQAASWVGPVPMEKVYQLNPVINGLDEKYKPQVLGASGTLWTDQFIHGYALQEILPLNENRAEKYIDYFSLPRLSALAEVTWSLEKNKQWNDFENRMRSHYLRYKQTGYGFRLPQPKIVSTQKVQDGFLITVETLADETEIRYTTDGSYPTVYSTVYTQPVKVKNLADFYAITVLNRDQFSLPTYFPENYERFAPLGRLLGTWKSYKIDANAFTILDFNATGKITENGNYTVSLQHTSGASNLAAQGISVYKNGKQIATDLHDGETGQLDKNNQFKFAISEYETGAEFKIKVRVKGVQGNDTNGAAFIKLEK
jgi:hexosaminidase